MRVPFYKQQLDFTCGPACLLMAMGAHDAATPLTLAHEVDIWREATIAVVPATSRHGLALAAHRRGFRVRIIASHEGLAFRKRIEERAPEFYRGNALGVLWGEVFRRAREAGVPEELRPVTVADLDAALDAGEIAILLTSTRYFGEPDEHIPHWVVVARREGDAFLVLNPLDDAPSTAHVPRETMEKALGFDGDQEVIFIGPRDAGDTQPSG